ncbi:hypothetical protein Aiant_63650 [Actinoplanes ianthinogenes]|uniref:Uncharacterized protein n=1 Tax=Actinoplanes ianthinogenes TaxID=122358 RepID=A0ABM7M2C4_9ACTN|nr:hypothetical protein Aiant_63650 [Actinoplanes ianthinogenes]
MPDPDRPSTASTRRSPADGPRPAAHATTRPAATVGHESPFPRLSWLIVLIFARRTSEQYRAVVAAESQAPHNEKGDIRGNRKGK